MNIKTYHSEKKCFSMAYYDVHFVYNTKNVLLNFYMETEDRREIEEK